MAARLKVERRAIVDTNRLYGDLEDAIAYLIEVQKAHPDWKLDEHEVYYGTTEVVFTYDSYETDDEYFRRKSAEKREAELSDALNRALRAKLAAIQERKAAELEKENAEIHVPRGRWGEET